MPTYVYSYLDKADQPTDECFELVQSIADDALTTHEGRKVRRVPQAPTAAARGTKPRRCPRPWPVPLHQELGSE